MNDAQPKSRGGRPQKFPGEGPRVTQATRLRSSIAARLAEEADRNHRSIGEEIEYRINKSFDSLVVDVDANTLDKYNTRAKELNQSIEEYAKYSMLAWNMVEKNFLEHLPMFRDLTRILEAFRAAQIGFVIMHIMGGKSFEISDYLRKQLTGTTPPQDDFPQQQEASITARKALDDVHAYFDSKFGEGSLEKIIVMTEDMLIKYVKEHTGEVLDKKQLAESTIAKHPNS